VLILPFKPLLLGRVLMIGSVEPGGPSLFEPSLKIKGNTGHINSSGLAAPTRLASTFVVLQRSGPLLSLMRWRIGNHSLPDRMTPALVTALPPNRIGHATARRPERVWAFWFPRTLNNSRVAAVIFLAESKQTCRGGGDIHLVTANSRCQVLSYPARRFRS
jgi:hypothetical protein